MQTKQLSYSDEARAKLLSGVNQLAKAVVTTLGPRGRNVAIDNKWGPPTILHDGVSVAKEIVLEDKFENMGAQLVKEAASKTNDEAGDGTTTSTLLAQQLVQQGMKSISAGVNPMMMKKGVDQAVKVVVEELKKISKVVKKEDWVKVATISAQNKEIGQKITEALEIVGENGIVEVEESRGVDIQIVHKDGMAFDKGYVSGYFVTDRDNMEAVIDKPFILLTDQTIQSIDDIGDFLENMVKVSKNVVIVANAFEGDTIAALVMNKMRNILNIVCVTAPGFGDRRKALLEDLAIVTGATIISSELGRDLSSITMADLGSCERIVVSKSDTKVIEGTGEKSELEARIAQIKKDLDRETSEFDKAKLQERLAKLAGGVAIIKVGASSDVELREIKERVKDAVGATKAAIEEGIIPGGGVALLRASSALDGVVGENEDENIGIKIVRKALEQPLRWLAKNSGADDGWVVQKVLENKNKHYGFNAATLEFGDMMEMGVLDPMKVTRKALQNAASVASMILTTECLITSNPEDKEKNG